MYGDYLFERREFSQAALGRRNGDDGGFKSDLSVSPVFVQAGSTIKAMISYERALDWRELFDLAVRESTSQDELAEIGLRVAGKTIVLSTYVGNNQVCADDLSSKKRYAEAATVLLDYAGDVRQAVIAYVEGNLFADARRIVSSLHPLGGASPMAPC